MKILVVDDETFVRDMISSYLTDKGYKDIDLAEDGQTAHKKYKNKKYDVVITDIRMPNMDGMELLKKIKEADEETLTDVILITGYSDIKHSMNVLKMGAYEYFEKPIDMEKLIDTLKRIKEKRDII